MGQVLLYIGASLPLIWGIAHLVPTRSIVAGFGEISADNRRILAMEWINEGVTLIFIGALVIGVTLTGSHDAVVMVVYWMSAVALLTLAVISIFTGFKIAFVPFRVCPFLFSAAALLIILGSVLR